VEANAVGLLAWLEPFDVFQKPDDVGTSVLIPPCTGLEKQGAYSLRTFNLTDTHKHTYARAASIFESESYSVDKQDSNDTNDSSFRS